VDYRGCSRPRRSGTTYATPIGISSKSPRSPTRREITDDLRVATSPPPHFAAGEWTILHATMDSFAAKRPLPRRLPPRTREDRIGVGWQLRGSCPRQGSRRVGSRSDAAGDGRMAIFGLAGRRTARYWRQLPHRDPTGPHGSIDSVVEPGVFEVGRYHRACNPRPSR
jgi:hypothetical protein